MQQVVKRMQLMRVVSVLKQNSYGYSFGLLKAYVEYRNKRLQLMKSLPVPRRKLWWEKLREKEYEHLYRQASLLKAGAPRQYRYLYDLLIKQKQMGKLVRIQRFVRKRQMNMWLEAHHIGETGFYKKSKKVTMDLTFMQPRESVDCQIF